MQKGGDEGRKCVLCGETHLEWIGIIFFFFKMTSNPKFISVVMIEMSDLCLYVCVLACYRSACVLLLSTWPGG